MAGEFYQTSKKNSANSINMKVFQKYKGREYFPSHLWFHITLIPKPGKDIPREGNYISVSSMKKDE